MENITRFILTLGLQLLFSNTSPEPPKTTTTVSHYNMITSSKNYDAKTLRFDLGSWKLLNESNDDVLLSLMKAFSNQVLSVCLNINVVLRSFNKHIILFFLVSEKRRSDRYSGTEHVPSWIEILELWSVRLWTVFWPFQLFRWGTHPTLSLLYYGHIILICSQRTPTQ